MLGSANRVKGRSDMARILANAMEASYTKFNKDERQDYEGNLLKSYLVELHSEQDDDYLAQHIKEINQISKSFDAIITETDDPSLVIFTSPNYSVEFFIDFLHPRFILLHTLSKSINADKFLSRLIKSSPHIDRAWFPSKILEDASMLGRFEGFGVRFDSTIYQAGTDVRYIEDEEDWNPLDNRLISLSLRTPKGARRQLKKLREKGVFPYASALSWIRVRVLNNDTGHFALEDITYFGKFTARGSSFTDHQHVLAAVRDEYGASVERIENLAGIGASPNESGLKIDGEPLVLEFPRPIRNIDITIPRMFTSAEPYRFWGVPRKVNDRLIRVHAVDLHIGQNLALEISPKNIVAYLPRGTCGNTITRLYSNVQRTLDPAVTIRGEESWLAPQPVTLT